MIEDEQTPRPARDGAFLATCALLATALACSIVVLAMPRPVHPSQLPALRLPRQEVAAALASDRELAKSPPRSAAIDQFLALYMEEGLAEREPRVDAALLAAQRAQLKRLVESELPKLDGQQRRALMAWLAERAMAGLLAERAELDAFGLLGAFPALLLRYGYLDGPRDLRAPELSVRAFYKARFNLICERPADSDLTPLERQAYEGWNALHAGTVPPSRRALAAKAFAEAGGVDAREALAIWLYNGGMHEQAAQLLESEYERTGALRLRNMLLVARR